MFNISNTVPSTTATCSTIKCRSTNYVCGTSLPLLQRNLRRRLRKLAKNESESMWKAVDTTSKSTMVDDMPLNKAPYLKRNIRIQRVRSALKISRKEGARKLGVGNVTNVHSQYRVHCIKYEISQNMRKSTVMKSFMCPAYQCPLNCSYEGVDFENVWYHCVLVHGDQHKFHPIQTTNKERHLLIEQNQPLSSLDVSLDKTDLIFYRRSPSNVRPAFHKTFLKRFPLPVRTYYHDVTFHPISLTEWLCGRMSDNDRESEKVWRRIVDTSALYDLADVAENEKSFMALWNEYMRNHPIIAALQLPSQLKSFVQKLSVAIFDKLLEDELVKHLTNMWVEGHIGREDVLDSMKIYNALVDGKHCRRNVPLS